MSRSTFDRLTGGITMLALATLVTSVLAIYFEEHVDSSDYLLAGSEASPEPGSDGSIQLPRPSTRGFIERPAVEVVARPPVEQARIRGGIESTAAEQAPAVDNGHASRPALADATGNPASMKSDRVSTATSADADTLTAILAGRTDERSGSAAPEHRAGPVNPALAGLAALGTDPAEAIDTMTRQDSPAAIAAPAPLTDLPALPEPTPADRPDAAIDRAVSGEVQTGPATEAAAPVATDPETPKVTTVLQAASVAHLTRPEAESPGTGPEPDRAQLALASTPAIDAPVETGTSETVQAASPALDRVPVPGDNGRWIINLASYAGPRTADRMQRKFENLGVSTDRQVAEVNGKTMYRLRIAAFRTHGDAEAYFNSIKDRLGLESAWITKQ
jgi:hypothetical protein